MKTKIISLILLLALLLLPTSNAYAQSPSGDVFLMGQNYTLKSGETLDGSLAVIGGNITIEKGAIVNGDTVLVGGNIAMDGKANGEIVIVGGSLTVTSKVDGGIVVVGGQVDLAKTAVVTGDITSVGGQVNKAPGAEVGGNIVNNAPPINIPDVPNIPNVPVVPNVPNSPSTDTYTNPFWQATGVIGFAVLMALIAMVLSLFLQPQMERVADAITHQPFIAGSFGLLTSLVAPIAIVIMSITIILIPVALITAFLLPMTWLFGMIALGQEVGERFTKAINQTWAPVLTTGFGTFLFLLLFGFVKMIPCIGWLAAFLISLIAIGSVAMTMFGSRSAPGKPITQPQIVEVPPAS
ncbi:MAG: hypothetical protein HZB50_18975 [Chloroflexi bacterium]|nr:hypothetical protein [Chloroflexota bacterium]